MVDTWKEVAFKDEVSAMRYLLCSPVISAQWRKP